MVENFKASGFDGDCEYLYADNSVGNRFDAYRAYNAFLRLARGEFIVLCHQDILLLKDDRERLDALLSELDLLDPLWGICGNAGVHNATRESSIRISDPTSEDLSQGGPFPRRVNSLDENFMVARSAANLALSRDLSGFHWYGHDICLIAETLGWSVYVIDFHLRHKSPGTPDAAYRLAGQALRRKYAAAFQSRWQISVSGGREYISESRFKTFRARGFNKLRRVALALMTGRS